jgi:hypothetical protein
VSRGPFNHPTPRTLQLTSLPALGRIFVKGCLQGKLRESSGKAPAPPKHLGHIKGAKGGGGSQDKQNRGSLYWSRRHTRSVHRVSRGATGPATAVKPPRHMGHRAGAISHKGERAGTGRHAEIGQGMRVGVPSQGQAHPAKQSHKVMCCWILWHTLRCHKAWVGVARLRANH